MILVFFDIYNLLFSLLVSFVTQIVFFAIAATYKTDKVTDLSYGLTFIIIALTIMLLEKAYRPVQVAMVVMVTLWGIRLATYLFIRILKTGKDKRFDGIRENFLKFAHFWTLQAFSVWIIMIPATIILSLDDELNLGYSTLIGGLIWLFGLATETIADYQKYVFKSRPENKGKWIGSGLWHYSRHPNYFGEILCWWGLFVIALPFLKGSLWLSIIGPIFITFLILFVTGIPTLEKKYDQRYKNNQDYQDYKNKTSVLIPRPPKG